MSDTPPQPVVLATRLDAPTAQALIIPLADLPAGTQISISIIMGPPEPDPAPAPVVEMPQRRYIGGSR